jgi:hypothetical protein
MADFVSYDQNTGEGILGDGRRLPVDDSMVPGVTKLPAPGATPAAQKALADLHSVTSKLDAPPGAATAAGAQMPGMVKTGYNKTETTQMGLDPGSVEKSMAPVAAAENAYADEALGAVTEQHDQRAEDITRRKQDVQVSTLDAQQKAADDEQNAKIARLNEGAIRAQEDPNVDPKRLVNSMSTGTKILTVLLSALGGAGGALSGGGNAALAALNKAVDDDIMAQKEQINSGRIRRGNLVQYFQQQGMSLEASSAAAKGVAMANVEKLADLEAQSFGNDVALSNAKLLKPKLAAERAKHDAELKLQLEGMRGSSTTKQNTYQAGGMGGATSSDALKDALAKRDLKELGDTGLTHDERTARDKPTTAQEAKAEAISGMQGLHDTLLGLPDKVYTSESSSLPTRVLHGATDFALGKGMGEKLDPTLSKKDLEQSQAFTQARAAYLAQLSVMNKQGAMAGGEYQNAVDAAHATNSPAALRKAIENTLKSHGAAPKPIPYKEVK